MILALTVQIIQLQLILIYNRDTIVEHRLHSVYPCLFYVHFFTDTLGQKIDSTTLP